MPTLNLGQVRPVYRGAWNSIDTYSAYDFVIYNGSAYLALKDVPANYEPPSQTEYWVLFGAKGEPGAPGADGENGAQGERGPSPAYRWDGTFLSIQNPDGTWPDQGIDLQGPAVPLSNSVTSTSETDAASSKAVKTAYDLAASKQNALGFTPVQQSGGMGQDNSKIYIGGSPEGLRVQMGATDLGNIVTTRAGITKAISATTADTANGIGTHPWFDSLDPGGNPPWVMGLATDGSNKLRPFDPAVLRVSYAASANVAASAGIADMRVYATKTFSSVTSFTLPAGGSWLVIATSASTTGGFVGVYAGGSTVTSGGPVLANCIQIAR